MAAAGLTVAQRVVVAVDLAESGRRGWDRPAVSHRKRAEQLGVSRNLVHTARERAAELRFLRKVAPETAGGPARWAPGPAAPPLDEGWCKDATAAALIRICAEHGPRATLGHLHALLRHPDRTGRTARRNRAAATAAGLAAQSRLFYPRNEPATTGTPPATTGTPPATTGTPPLEFSQHNPDFEGRPEILEKRDLYKLFPRSSDGGAPESEKSRKIEDEGPVSAPSRGDPAWQCETPGCLNRATESIYEPGTPMPRCRGCHLRYTGRRAAAAEPDWAAALAESMPADDELGRMPAELKAKLAATTGTPPGRAVLF